MFEQKLNGLKLGIFYLFVITSSVVLITSCGGDSSEGDSSNQNQTVNKSLVFLIGNLKMVSVL